jgi:all-trans-8'-apo-beta-carotenal 15,15'-oxygenase
MTEVTHMSTRRERGWDGAALQAAFEQASKSRPWTLGYRSFDQDRVESAATLSGRWPSDLRGVLFRNGPARHERGGLRYGHRWDGDGMLQRFAMSDAGVTHIGQYVHTAKYATDSSQGKLTTSGFGTRIPGSEVLEGPIDDANSANISVIQWAGDLLALWEPGSAYAVDPKTLATRGAKTWSEALKGKPFSAHPRIETDGTLWNFGVDPVSSELVIYRIRSDGRLVASHVLQIDHLPPTHDFAVTERHLVFLLPSLTVNKERLSGGASFAEACQWSPEYGMKVLILDKADWSQQWLELPPGCLFHIANAWEGSDGGVVVDYMRSDDPISLVAGWSVMAGEYRHRKGAHLTSASLNPRTGSATQTTIGEFDSEFPVVAPAEVGKPHQSILYLERSADRRVDVPGFDVVALRDVRADATQRFAYGEGWLVEEHLFAAPPGELSPRWIVGTALDTRADQTVLSVFEVDNVADGPIAQARLRYSLPLGLHGSYTPT